MIVVVSALGSALADLHLTAVRPADRALALLVGGLVVLASSRATPAAWLAASLLLGALGGGPIAPVGLALGLSLVAMRVRTAPGERVIGAAIGAALLYELLHLPHERTGRNALVAIWVIGVLLVTAWSRIGAPSRARTQAVATRALAIAGLALAGLIVAAALAARDLRDGMRSAEAGLEAARDGEGDEAAALLDEASDSFESAGDALTAWWTRPALMVPVVGEHARALTVATDTGAGLARAAAAAARAAQVDDLEVVDGRLDLDQVRSMAAPLASVRSAIAEADTALAEVDTDWLLPPVAERLDDFKRTLDAAAGEAESASEAVALLPDLLGGNGPRRYFVAFGTPAETRELGGFMGAYATLLADDGELSLVATGRVRDINEALRGRKLSNSAAFPAHYLAFQPQRFWQNITATADFPTLAEAVRQMWTPLAGPLDGVIYMDPTTLADLLDLTGPIRVPDLDEPLTAETAGPFLLRDQYIEFPDDDRHDFLVDAAKTVFDELTSGSLPRPGVIADTLAPAIRERRLILGSFRAAEQRLFERFRLDGALPPVDGDFLSVRASNRGLNKIDAMMRRSLDYSVTVDPGSDRVTATLTVEVANDAPGSGLPDAVIGNRVGQPTGTNSTTISVYTPLDLVDVVQQGRSIGRGAFEEHGRKRYTAQVDVPPGQTVTVVFELEGRMDLSDGYRLDVVPQPLVNPDRLRVTVDGPSGWRSGGRDGPWAELREAEQFEVHRSNGRR